MTTIDQLRRDATVLKRAFFDQDQNALLRVAALRPRPDGMALKHADFLHVIARERGFATWPRLKTSVQVIDSITPYAHARIFGNTALVQHLDPTPLTETEALLAQIADGETPQGQHIDPAKMPPAVRNIIREFAQIPGKLPHLKRLKPDPGHINGHGGTLLSSILHGSEANSDRENSDYEANSDRENSDYIACLQLALDQGVAIPRNAHTHVADPDIAAFLRDWAAAKPGQVVDT